MLSSSFFIIKYYQVFLSSSYFCRPFSPSRYNIFYKSLYSQSLVIIKSCPWLPLFFSPPPLSFVFVPIYLFLHLRSSPLLSLFISLSLSPSLSWFISLCLQVYIQFLNSVFYTQSLTFLICIRQQFLTSLIIEDRDDQRMRKGRPVSPLSHSHF